MSTLLSSNNRRILLVRWLPVALLLQSRLTGSQHYFVKGAASVITDNVMFPRHITPLFFLLFFRLQYTQDKMIKKFGTDTDEALKLEEEQEVKPPSLFKVFLINDDYTTMEFVVHILEKVFRKSIVEATQVMLHVHKNGRGLAGVYTRGIAETKVAKVDELAQLNEFPLKCTMENE